MGIFDGIGDAVGGLAGRVGSAVGLGSTGEDDAAAAMAEWKKQAGQWSDKWGNVANFDQVDPTTGQTTRTAAGKRFDELSKLYTGEVDQGAAQAGTQTAAAYSRRGAADSGYAMGGQQDVMMKAAAARAQAREAARNAAVGEQEGILSAQSSLSMAPYQGDAMYAAAMARQKQSQQDANMQALLGYLAGRGAFGGGGAGGGADTAGAGFVGAPALM